MVNADRNNARLRRKLLEEVHGFYHVGVVLVAANEKMESDEAWKRREKNEAWELWSCAEEVGFILDEVVYEGIIVPAVCMEHKHRVWTFWQKKSASIDNEMLKKWGCSDKWRGESKGWNAQRSRDF